MLWQTRICDLKDSDVEHFSNYIEILTNVDMHCGILLGTISEWQRDETMADKTVGELVNLLQQR